MHILKAALLSAAIPLAAVAQTPAPAPALTYADLADLAQAAPVVVDVEVRRARRLSASQAPDVGPGATRFLIEATLLRLIRGAAGVPGQISYVVDLPNDARGRPPKIAAKTRYLLFAVTTPGRADQLRLASPSAQIAWTPEEDARIRAVITALLDREAPPRITAVAGAFHVPGAIPGESETQIFLRTADNRPISLNILRRPGETPRWAVALGEMTDDSARPPARDTLLWYRLACGLPRALPDGAVADLGPNEANAARADYRVVLDGLGACTRTQPAIG